VIGTYAYPLILSSAYNIPQTVETGQIAAVEGPPHQANWVPNAPGRYFFLARATKAFCFAEESVRTQFQVLAENDDFVNAITIPPATRATNYTFNMLGTSGEGGEPRHKKAPALRSLWWKWTPSYSGSVRLKAVSEMHGVPLDVFVGTGL